LTVFNELVLSTHAGSFIDLVKLDQDRTIIINFPLLFFQVSLIQLAESNRNLFPLFHVQLNDHLLAAFTVYFQALIHISRLIEAYYCVLEMGEDVLLLDFNLTSSLLLIAVKGIGAVWADN
jgi:hypothetical protein